LPAVAWARPSERTSAVITARGWRLSLARSHWGRAGAAHHRKTTDNSGERRSADRAGQQPSPSVRPGHTITPIVSRTEEARPDPQPPAGVRTLGPRPGSCPLCFGRVRMSRLLIPGRPLSRQERGAVRFHRSIRVRPTRPAAVHLHAARRLQDHSCAAPLARARRCNTCRPANAVSDTYAHHGKAEGPVICGAVRSRSNPPRSRTQRSAIASASPQGHGAPGGGHRRRRPQRRSPDR
jgi:hypothetical protein